jgi:hypothetical protein
MITHGRKAVRGDYHHRVSPPLVSANFKGGSMKKIYNLAVKTGTYESNGEAKNRYEHIGAVMEGENSQFIFLKRTFNPAGVPHKQGSLDIIISMFKPHTDQPDPEYNDNDITM